ncbi:MAG: PIN domain-containing protein [Deltaproteobacteria bacterium]|nr:PIN domain-containing protein [Deltaproteobacteria bacterium]MBI3387402.1 PIN domain-containing protein [Deltaproteobacteria bacterium]
MRPSTPSVAAPARVLVDSGAWIALVRAKDQYHASAEQMFRDAIRHRIRLVTTNLILAEVQRFILFHVGIQPALHVLDRIEASPLLTIEFTTAAHHAAARKWLAQFPDQRISYTDAVSFAVMRAMRCTTAMGFDHDFELAGFALWRPGDARG